MCKKLRLNFIKLFFISFFVWSCSKTKVKNQSDVEFPAGKWRVISLQNKNKRILFNKNGNYFVELSIENKITVNAEDNSLYGNFIDLKSDSLKLESIEMTDICCNSDTAKILFHFFANPSKFFQNSNNLTLSSQKGILEMKK